MATKRTSFLKRQKEQKRIEKAIRKREDRMQRRFEKSDEKREQTMGSFTTTFSGVKVRAGTVGVEQRGQIHGDEESARPDFIWFDDFETRKSLRSAVCGIILLLPSLAKGQPARNARHTGPSVLPGPHARPPGPCRGHTS